MHELSIAMSILDVAEEEMQSHAGATLEAIHIRLGPLSGIVKESLLSAYELAREQTPFPQAKLVFEDVPIVVFCSTCNAERPVDSVQNFCCAECDTPASQVVRGRELELAALELEEGP
jgi:hydrogenase nickel incorporation protein HypA/HybF